MFKNDVVHISTSDNRGGAARSAYRLHQELWKREYKSLVYVKNKYTSDDSVLQFSPNNSVFNRFFFKIRRKWETDRIGYIKTDLSNYVGFAAPTSPYRFSPLKTLPKADIINLHWVSVFFDFRSLPLLTNFCNSVVWRFSDMNPFTGGCFYDNNCGRFAQSCGMCPCLHSNNQNDLSMNSIKLKQKIISKLPQNFIHIIAQSRWMKNMVKASSIFQNIPVTIIPNGVNIQRFRPIDSKKARAKLNIPLNQIVVLFVSQSLRNPVKGRIYFLEAIRKLASITDKCITVLAIGKHSMPSVENVTIIQEYIEDDEKLAHAFSAADIFVITSLQDNLPSTVLESMACGTPVVGFSVGGIPDMVIDNQTGFLVPSKDTEALVEKILTLIHNRDLRLKFSMNGRKHIVNNFSIEKQADSYIDLYQSLLK